VITIKVLVNVGGPNHDQWFFAGGSEATVVVTRTDLLENEICCISQVKKHDISDVKVTVAGAPPPLS
jgi:hypothetical protein